MDPHGEPRLRRSNASQPDVERPVRGSLRGPVVRRARACRMTAIATVDYDARVHRIAFPQRSPLTETLVDAEDRSALAALLASTSVIESHRAGERRIVAPEDDYVGDHRDYVLAPFAYRAVSRFSDGSFGVLYAAESRDTALHEV